MKYAIIDIGSNSMRLTVYSVEKESFTILFKEKIMAGLASYMEHGTLTEEGIRRAGAGLLSFAKTLDHLEITNVSAFATASLRNVHNTQQATQQLSEMAGFPIQVLSGEEEATLGFAGAMQDTAMDSGLFIDIGGASTELVEFEHGQINQASSFPIGSLKLYRDCVKHILPGNGSYTRMEKALKRELGKLPTCQFPGGQIAAVGGSARAALKLARTVFQLPQTCRTFTAQQLDEIFSLLRSDQRTATDLILKAAPERLHTLIPGLMILRHIVKTFDASEVIVSRYGVREGYLCQKIQSKL
ncbi:hypothetical protein H9X86_10045 [Pseudoflavonifractor capillosus]|uniref:Ppx/GppA phosphatase family protein n=1 Tax=Pseudoflavonifractor capillosus TaxID=106588 RepID=UPI0019574E05|nr:hypothetical protein [Pseudoflavonifractor capillosus]MBM6897695.1 hypothetical protein [Pseudoflavonifractor capillosus]